MPGVWIYWEQGIAKSLLSEKKRDRLERDPSGPMLGNLGLRSGPPRSGRQRAVHFSAHKFDTEQQPTPNRNTIGIAAWTVQLLLLAVNHWVGSSGPFRGATPSRHQTFRLSVLQPGWNLARSCRFLPGPQALRAVSSALVRKRTSGGLSGSPSRFGEHVGVSAKDAAIPDAEICAVRSG